MTSDWTYALDMCAAHGILDYDAAADILGQKPRFVGHPKLSELQSGSPMYLPEDTKMKTSPLEDEFVKPDSGYIQNPTWKKVLMGAIATAGIGAAIIAVLTGKGKIKLPKFNLKNIKMPDMSKLKNGAKNIFNSVCNFAKKAFNSVANFFKKKP